MLGTREDTVSELDQPAGEMPRGTESSLQDWGRGSRVLVQRGWAWSKNTNRWDDTERDSRQWLHGQTMGWGQCGGAQDWISQGWEYGLAHSLSPLSEMEEGWALMLGFQVHTQKQISFLIPSPGASHGPFQNPSPIILE